MSEIRGNAVSVGKLFRARCHLAGCGWTGTQQATYQDANTERQDHLTWHRLGQAQHSCVRRGGGHRYGECENDPATAAPQREGTSGDHTDEPEEPEPDEYDPGPEVDDEGGMSEYRHAVLPAGQKPW